MSLQGVKEDIAPSQSYDLGNTAVLSSVSAAQAGSSAAALPAVLAVFQARKEHHWCCIEIHNNLAPCHSRSNWISQGWLGLPG